MKSIDNGSTLVSYTYDTLGRMDTETQTFTGRPARTVAYQYDADGLRSDLTHPSGKAVDYQWTAKGQLDNLNRDIALNPPPPDLAEYTYDKAGRLVTLSHENTITQERQYDTTGQLLANLHKKAGNTVSGHQYAYDDTGRRTAETFPGTATPARTYGYDNADQVTSANYDGGGTQTDAYAYDPAGNRSTATVIALGGTATTYTANSVNQYTSITGISAPVHDANGNLTSQNGVTYTWDSENRLLSVSDGTTINTFTYDAQHRRVTKRTAVSGTVTNKVHYVYDGWNVIEERTNTDTTPGFDLTTFTLTKTQTWGTDLSGTLQGAGGVGGLLMVEEITSTTTTAYHFHYDGNGNVTEITDHTGSSAATYRYDAFGNTLVATGSYAATNRYRFSTKPLDSEVANAPLYYYGYRYYDPVTGRWPSRDPIGERGGLNLYGFCLNQPTNGVDVLGKFLFLAPAAPAAPAAGAALTNLAISGLVVLGLWEVGTAAGEAYHDSDIPTPAPPAIPVPATPPRPLDDSQDYSINDIYPISNISAQQRAAKIKRCDSLHAQYSRLKCGKCRNCRPCIEITLNFGCKIKELYLRQTYLNLRCDYLLQGSIDIGSQIQEKAHEDHINNNLLPGIKRCIKAFWTCTAGGQGEN